VHVDGTVQHTMGWPRDAADRNPLQLVTR